MKLKQLKIIGYLADGKTKYHSRTKHPKESFRMNVKILRTHMDRMRNLKLLHIEDIYFRLSDVFSLLLKGEMCVDTSDHYFIQKTLDNKPRNNQFFQFK